MFLLYFLYIQLLLSSFTYGFVTKDPLHSLSDLENPAEGKLNLEDFNALDDLTGMIQDDLTMSDIQTDNKKVQIDSKKSDFKPKYDPGWKFIGLGKRPLRKEVITYNGRYPYDQLDSYDNNNAQALDYPSTDYADAKVNPLLSISALINFEIFNAIRDGIAEATREMVKKGEMDPSKLYAGSDPGSNRFSSRVGMYGGRQKVMYDPGWMLTGLGK